jgi:hypothetical protein
LAELYLLLATWVGTQVTVVQDNLDLSPFRQLKLPGVSWEGDPAANADVWMTVPPATIGSDDTLDTLHAWLQRLRQPDPVRLSIEKIVVEAVDNALEHSRPPFPPLLIATLLGDSVECAIVDAGRGVRKALADNPTYADLASDVTAVRLALQEGVSGIPKPGRGSGLPTICRAIAAQAGTLIFRSGAGQVTYESTVHETRGIEMRVQTPAPGAQVLVEIPLRKPLT